MGEYQGSWCAFLRTLYQWYIISVCLITDNVKCEHLVKVVSAMFVHCKVILFFCIINKCFGGGTLRKYMCILVCIHTLFTYLILNYNIYIKKTYIFVQITQTSNQH